MVPESFAGYRLDAVAGRGGMGVVYRATEVELGRSVALKVIAPDSATDPVFRQRFERESRLTASIDHPNVIPVFEAGEHDGQLFIAMRFVEGTDLREVLKRRILLRPEDAVAIIRQVADALDAAHARGLIHRDVKPANVLISADDHVYLTDFGLTRKISGSDAVTAAGAFIGTIDYASPEQLLGESLDARTDVYSLGCMLHHTVTGQPPFLRETRTATILAHMEAPPPRVSELVPGAPGGLDDVIGRALAKAPAERYESAGELAQAATAAIQAPRPRRPADIRASVLALRDPFSRPRVLIPVAIAATAAIGVGTLVLGSGGGDEPSAEPSATVREFVEAGADRCELLTDAFVSAYGGLDQCRERLGARTPAAVRIEDTSVSADQATVDSVAEETGERFRFRLVREDGRWLIAAVNRRRAPTPSRRG